MTRHIALLWIGACVSEAMAQSPGTFTTAGTMTTPRFSHTATLLLDGTVLLAGGFTSDVASVPTASAELYDPLSGTFAATGNMITARIGHTATLLPDGKVLIAGGEYDFFGRGISAEVYDPTTGTFSLTGNMNVKRMLHTATLLNNGNVLITGGTRLDSDLAYNWLSSAELYDPSTGTFAPTGDMTEPSADTATLLPDGQVLITRSYFYDGAIEHFVGHTDVYDLSTGLFSRSGDKINVNALPTANLLMTGKVLIAGGPMSAEGGGASVSAELCDASDGICAATGDLTTGRQAHASTLLPDGTVLFAGGHVNYSDSLTSAEIYNPATGAFRDVGDMITGRERFTATLLNIGKILIAGGLDYHNWPEKSAISAAELYTPSKLAPPPVLFSLSQDGRGQGAIWHAETGQIASSQDPATAGEVLSMYTTSLGDGSMIPPQVAVGGHLSKVLFFGSAPGYPDLNQINFRVPSGVAPRPAVPVRLTYLGRSSNGVTIGVR